MITRSGCAKSNDGLSIHWNVIGQGTPLVCSNGVGVSTFFWKYIIERYSSEYAILLWDYRGHGDSERNVDPHSVDMRIERHALDLCTVLEDAFPDYTGGLFLMGHSMGCQVNLEAYRILRERVIGIVHLLGTAGHALSTFGGFKYSPYIFRAAKRITFKLGGAADRLIHPLLKSRIAWPFTSRLALVDPIYTDYADFKPYLDHLATMDLRLFTTAAWACQEHSAWDLLPEVQCPVLVFAAENDGFTPISCAQDIARQLPFGSLIVLADGSHAALIEQPEVINYNIDKFFGKVCQ